MEITVQHWLLALLAIPAQAAAALPLIITLGLIAGRRGNGRFCLQCNFSLLNFCLILAPAGALAVFWDLCLQIPPRDNFWDGLGKACADFAGLPYTTTLLAWLCGYLLLLLARFWPPAPGLIDSRDRLRMAPLKKTLALCLGATFCFFATFWLANWPFAGLPQGLEWDRAIMAIIRNAMRHYFVCFCPSGALALCYALDKFDKNPAFTPEQRRLGRRWLAVWAACGIFPGALTQWGLILGLALRGNLAGQLASGHAASFASLCCVSLAMICWISLIIAKSDRCYLAWAGLGLLIIRQSAPFIMKFGVIL